MKAILVIEMTENCLDCSMEMDAEDISGNAWQGNICRGCGKRHADKSKKPDWCPLVPMPERKMELKKKTYFMGEYAQSIYVPDPENVGWNACLDAIEGSRNRLDRKQPDVR